MVSAQQQSEDAEITDEGREALLERIQALTTTESEVKQSLLEAEQVIHPFQRPEAAGSSSIWLMEQAAS